MKLRDAFDTWEMVDDAYFCSQRLPFITYLAFELG